MYDCLMYPCKTLEDCQNKSFDFEDIVDIAKKCMEYGYNKAKKEARNVIEILLHKLIMACAPYKTDLTKDEIAEIKKFLPKENEKND